MKFKKRPNNNAYPCIFGGHACYIHTLALSVLMLASSACQERARGRILTRTNDNEDIPWQQQVEGSVVFEEDQTLVGLLYIPRGQSLRVMPDVTLTFQSGAGIVVEGTLLVEGLPQAPVTLLGRHANVGIVGQPQAQEVSLIHTDNQGVPIDVDAPVSFTMRDVLLQDLDRAVWLRQIQELSLEDIRALRVEEVMRISHLSSAEAEDETPFADVQIDRFTATDVGSVITIDPLRDHIALQLNDVNVDSWRDAALDVAGALCSVTDSRFENGHGPALLASGNALLSLESLYLNNIEAHTAIEAGNRRAQWNDVQLNQIEGHGVTIRSGEISALSMQDIEGDALRIESGTLYINSSTLDSVQGRGIFVSTGSVEARNLRLDDIAEHAIEARSSDLSLEAMNISDILATGIYIDQGDLSLADSSLLSLRSGGIYARDGMTTLSDVRIEDSASSGVTVEYGSLEATSLNISQVRRTGIRAVGDVSLSDVQITQAEDLAINIDEGDVVMSQIDLEDCGGGISVGGGDLTITDSTITSMNNNRGIQLSQGALAIDNVTIEEVATQGVYISRGSITANHLSVTEAESIGIDIRRSTSTLDQTTVDNTNGYGIYADEFSETLIRGAEVLNASSYGIYLKKQGRIQQSYVHHNRHGVYIGGDGLSSLESSTVEYNTEFGIQSQSSTFLPNQTRIIGNNVVGNGRHGIRYVEQVSGNYVADNNLAVGQDLTTGGVLDGNRTTKSDTSPQQIANVDIIVNQAGGLLLDAGLP